MKIPLIIAFGIEFRDYSHSKELEKYLNKVATKKKFNLYEYKYGSKQFEISIVFTKKEFLKALDTHDAIVIYDGHARYGQGPAFVDKPGVGYCPDSSTFPLNPWEDHVRMGWDAVKIPCIAEILKHCTNPTEFSKLEATRFIPKNVKRIINNAKRNSGGCKQKGITKRKLIRCFPKAAKKKMVLENKL